MPKAEILGNPQYTREFTRKILPPSQTLADTVAYLNELESSSFDTTGIQLASAQTATDTFRELANPDERVSVTLHGNGSGPKHIGMLLFDGFQKEERWKILFKDMGDSDPLSISTRDIAVIKEAPKSPIDALNQAFASVSDLQRNRLLGLENNIQKERAILTASEGEFFALGGENLDLTWTFEWNRKDPSQNNSPEFSRAVVHPLKFKEFALQNGRWNINVFLNGALTPLPIIPSSPKDRMYIGLYTPEE